MVMTLFMVLPQYSSGESEEKYENSSVRQVVGAWNLIHVLLNTKRE
jgi:hypothetical protein